MLIYVHVPTQKTNNRKVPVLNSKAKIRTTGTDTKIRTHLSHLVPRPANNKEDKLDKLRGRLRPRVRQRPKNKVGVPHMGGFAANLQNVRKESNLAGSFGVRTRVATGRLGHLDMEEEGRESQEDFDYEEYDNSWYDMLEEVRTEKENECMYTSINVGNEIIPGL